MDGSTCRLVHYHERAQVVARREEQPSAPALPISPTSDIIPE